MFRVMVSALAVVGLLALAAAFAHNSGRAEPTLTRSDSVLPPPEHLFYVDVAQAAPRSIPWDCSDWQESPAVEDADDARVSLILESLAANRGKAIYCAIDQSDTWTKTETWEAGRDRNERDDTVYFGQSGNFRGFLAAQEGYLTDGESGVTGVSRELIFEFPREEKKRRRWKKVIITLEVPVDDSACHAYDGPNYRNGPAYDPTCRRAIAPFGPETSTFRNTGNNQLGSGGWPQAARQRYNNNVPTFVWDDQAQEAATAYCLSEGYQRAVNVAATDPPLAVNTDWVYQRGTQNPAPGQQNTYKYRAARVNTWTATCEKTVRKRR